LHTDAFIYTIFCRRTNLKRFDISRAIVTNLLLHFQTFLFSEKGNPFWGMSRALIDRTSIGKVRSRNDEEDSESSESKERGGRRCKRKKNQFPRSGQRDAFIAIPSHDPEIGNSKGSSDLRSKNRQFYPLQPLL